jgi:hypothetical protein
LIFSLDPPVGQEGFHTAGAHHVDVVDAVRTSAHLRDQGCQFRVGLAAPDGILVSATWTLLANSANGP